MTAVSLLVSREITRTECPFSSGFRSNCIWPSSTDMLQVAWVQARPSTTRSMIISGPMHYQRVYLVRQIKSLPEKIHTAIWVSKHTNRLDATLLSPKRPRRMMDRIVKGSADSMTMAAILVYICAWSGPRTLRMRRRCQSMHPAICAVKTMLMTMSTSHTPNEMGIIWICGTAICTTMSTERAEYM